MIRGEPHRLSFTVPIFEPHPSRYYIRVVSDSWLHAESFYAISFHNLALPESTYGHSTMFNFQPIALENFILCVKQKMVNPAYYGLENAEVEMLNSYLSRIVQTTFEDVEDSGCIKIDGENVEPLVLGPDTSLEMFLHILSGASEDDELPVRHNEENYNEALSGRVRYIVDKNALDDPHVKANLLFHTHFPQLESPISDYVTDLKSVLGQSIRIIQAMVDICANSGWLSASVTCMHLLQMVMQGLWFEKDSWLQILYPCPFSAN
ncbi:hypothetical protein OIU84_017597 [Salix udensis]|uniref:SEC63 domain-containing protein n=1 Tax=Salix udensis TaxID=889485 RepID=A0AAD6L283_9ROSI|nr:hypothetical protein OIU84_017597 [Salix udensis]